MMLIFNYYVSIGVSEYNIIMQQFQQLELSELIDQMRRRRTLRLFLFRPLQLVKKEMVNRQPDVHACEEMGIRRMKEIEKQDTEQTDIHMQTDMHTMPYIQTSIHTDRNAYRYQTRRPPVNIYIGT